MLGGARRAERGDRVREAELRQRDHVHVALGDERVAAVAEGGAGFVQAVELAALAEDGRLGRVQVLGLFVAEHAPAEADALALDVADREHHAVAEAVVALGLLVAELAFLVVDDHQPALGEQRIVVVGEHAGQRAPAGRRVADAELLGDLARHAAALEVVDGAGRLAQRLAVSVAGLLEHVGQRGLFLALGGGAGAFGGRDVVFRHDQAVLAGQVMHGLDEAHARMFHEEADGVAMHAATEAVIELLGRADRERRRLLAVEGAQPHEIGAGLLELNVAADNFDHIGARDEFLDE
ncbi:hypothetical protein D9M68_552810 [compost metagenome]